MSHSRHLSKFTALLFFFGSAWIVASAMVYWLFLGEHMPPQPLAGLVVGTVAVLAAILLERDNPGRVLRRTARMVAACMLLLGLGHNVISQAVLPGANVALGLAQAHSLLGELPAQFFVGISLGVFAIILWLMSGRVDRGDATAWAVSLAIAVYLLLIGALAGVVFLPLRQTWGPIWLSFGLWLLAALLRRVPAQGKPVDSGSGPFVSA